MNSNKLMAFRDTYGYRPLFLGVSDYFYIFASEDSALKQFDFIEEIIPIKPGEVYTIENDQIIKELGLIRNHYSGRSFIQSDNVSRKETIRNKLFPIREVIENKSIALILNI